MPSALSRARRCCSKWHKHGPSWQNRRGRGKPRKRGLPPLGSLRLCNLPKLSLKSPLILIAAQTPRDGLEVVRGASVIRSLLGDNHIAIPEVRHVGTHYANHLGKIRRAG